MQRVIMAIVCFFCLPDVSTTTRDGGTRSPLTTLCIRLTPFEGLKASYGTVPSPSSQTKRSITIAQ